MKERSFKRNSYRLVVGGAALDNRGVKLCNACRESFQHTPQVQARKSSRRRLVGYMGASSKTINVPSSIRVAKHPSILRTQIKQDARKEEEVFRMLTRMTSKKQGSETLSMKRIRTSSIKT
jgi:hypothetical protein